VVLTHAADVFRAEGSGTVAARQTDAGGARRAAEAELEKWWPIMIGAAITVARIATGEIVEKLSPDVSK
jgi:hypothetical protein